MKVMLYGTFLSLLATTTAFSQISKPQAIEIETKFNVSLDDSMLATLNWELAPRIAKYLADQATAKNTQVTAAFISWELAALLTDLRDLEKATTNSALLENYMKGQGFTEQQKYFVRGLINKPVQAFNNRLELAIAAVQSLQMFVSDPANAKLVSRLISENTFNSAMESSIRSYKDQSAYWRFGTGVERISILRIMSPETQKLYDFADRAQSSVNTIPSITFDAILPMVDMKEIPSANSYR